MRIRIAQLVFQCMVAGLAVLFSMSGKAATPVAVHSEIQGLLSMLAKSGCEFNRNGNWYSSEKAVQHLRRKLNYIEQQGDLQNTEQFIELAATKSSLSGKAYQVRCAGSPLVSGQVWMLNALQQLRREQRAQHQSPS